MKEGNMNNWTSVLNGWSCDSRFFQYLPNNLDRAAKRKMTINYFELVKRKEQKELELEKKGTPLKHHLTILKERLEEAPLHMQNDVLFQWMEENKWRYPKLANIETSYWFNLLKAAPGQISTLFPHYESDEEKEYKEEAKHEQERENVRR